MGLAYMSCFRHFFSKFSLFPKHFASNCLFICAMFFTGNFLDLSGHVIGHALSWKKNDLLSYEMKHTRKLLFFFSQKLNLTSWPYVALNGDCENIFCRYLLSSPRPSLMDNVSRERMIKIIDNFLQIKETATEFNMLLGTVFWGSAS